MDTKTENPPPANGDPEPSEARKIVAWHRLLSDRVPAILWVPAWNAWVCKGDIPPTQFDNLQAYLDEFPLQVLVTDEYVTVTDPGFGNGAMEWLVRAFTLENGESIVAITETDANEESSESKIWAGKYAHGEWEDISERVIPAISRCDFFDANADLRILEDYELVSLQYVLQHAGNELHIIAKPNSAFECHDGKVVHDDVVSGDESLICHAWSSFTSLPIICTFDRILGKFQRP